MPQTTQTTCLAGLDEAGRGALAGPVVAGACILTDALERKFDTKTINDSKQLTPEQREAAFTWITEQCQFGIGSASAAEVDTLGILGATEQAMQRALAELEQHRKPTTLLVDGRDHFFFPYPKISVIRGDSTEACIAAASVLAKVTRDRMMVELHMEFPAYGFEQHKGYGTELHRAAIEQHGMCREHRRTFLEKSTKF